MPRSLIGFALGLLLVAWPASVTAQVDAEPEFDRVVSINPLALVILGLVSADYEQTLGQNTTGGVSAEYFDWRDRGYLSVDGKVRYYVSGRALEGLAIGTVLGFTRIGEDSEGEDARSRRSGTAIGVGFSAEHQWLLGEDERLALTTGLGGKRLFFLRDVAAQRALPMLRFSIGWAF